MKQEHSFQGGFKNTNSNDLVNETSFCMFALMSNVNTLCLPVETLKRLMGKLTSSKKALERGLVGEETQH